MTLPFENDTSAVTKKYAKRSIKTGKIKSVLSILTIMLSAALLSGFILSVVGMERNQNGNGRFLTMLLMSLAMRSK